MSCFWGIYFNIIGGVGDMRKNIYDINYNNIVDSAEKIISNGSTINPSDIVTNTTSNLQLYVNGSTGDDSNDGLTIGTPKKTLQAVVDLLPKIINHNISINMRGTFLNQGDVLIDNLVKSDKYIILDGGTDVNVVAGPFTTTSNSESSIEVSGEGFNETYDGYWIQIDDIGSPINGELRLIQKGSGDTLYSMKNFSAPPGNVLFNIVRPSTTWNGNSGTNFIYLLTGLVILQRIYFTGNNIRVYSMDERGDVSINSCIFNSENGQDIYGMNCKGLMFSLGPWNPITFTRESGFLGTSQIHLSGGIEFSNTQCACINSLYARKLYITNSSINQWEFGVRIKGQTSLVNNTRFSRDLDGNSIGWQPCINTNPNGAGIYVEDSLLPISGLVIENCNTNGIELSNSKLYHKGSDDLSGNGNLDFGIYIHSNSTMLITNNSSPTLTGNRGYITVDGINNTEKTWEDIDNGEQINVVNEALIKEIL